jgi:hypothetical protein
VQEKLSRGVLVAGACCSGTCLVPHPRRFTIAALIATPNVTQTRQVRKRGSAEEETADKRSAPPARLLGRISDAPSRQVHNLHTHRNAQRDNLPQTRRVSKRGLQKVDAIVARSDRKFGLPRSRANATSHQSRKEHAPSGNTITPKMRSGAFRSKKGDVENRDRSTGE